MSSTGGEGGVGRRLWFFVSAALFVALFAGVAALVAVGDFDEETPPRFFVYENGLGAAGYDVVAFFEEGAARMGADEWGARFAGQEWRFASEENRDLFVASPQRFVPVYGGHCAFGVAQGYLVRGDPNAWSVFEGRLYLNYSKSVRRTWLADVPGFLVRSEENWPGLAAGK